ncbi:MULTISPECIES: class I SAM-dependent methyltransferase [Acinetobacter]|uniref:class I SAM-dependent methyltransferase n=1 Tax=Acinetobacter TaxID=469 RepID=UPI0009947F6B|nr:MULTISPECIES: class I SAM-dependent methyltransferase [Acinetobacter]MCL6245414.1 class I SAM-dependent methyltransferase [Acinetobacter amyesii]OOV83152.1 leucine carboxyl methyltransferase [Acinetobacter sp. ANC 5600]UIJ75279.1 class I SAM-dependent methyltransferase [Acinetobacter sp. SH20PTE14]
MTQSLSEHRHISFTAHYTGYIWYSMGISHPVFATRKGKFLARLVHPLESWAEKNVGGSMRSTLKQRHAMIDQHLDQLIAQHPQLQVLEIACGLSPRGWNFRTKHPEIDYRELDLPDMAKIKTQALKQIDPHAPEVLTGDIFTQDFERIFQSFDPERPLVVISEGLINYFDQALLNKLLQGITEYGASFQELHYLTDIYPEPVKNRLARFIWASSKLLKVMSRSAFTFHFQSPAELQQFFTHTGFEEVKVVQPALYFPQHHQEQVIPFHDADQHCGDLVWMVHAKTKKQR